MIYKIQPKYDKSGLRKTEFYLIFKKGQIAKTV